MNKLILNLNHEFTIDNYSRNTNIGEDGKVYAYASITFTDASCYDELVALSAVSITDMIIAKMDGTSIIHLANQNAKITSIYENLSEDKVYMSANINFGNTESEPEV